MTLENIVPSLEVCKRIPQGSFTESALVWDIEDIDDCPNSAAVSFRAFIGIAVNPFTNEVVTSNYRIAHVPAPTLAEILAELPFGTIVMLDSPNTWVCIARLGEQGTKIKKATNPATAALLLWLELKGVQG